MSVCELTLTANAGVMLRMGDRAVLVDALHDRQVTGFSAMTEKLWRQLVAAAPAGGPDLIFFTHCHPDHFSPSLADMARRQWPAAAMVLPEPFFPDQRLLTGSWERLSLSGLTAWFARLPHEGAMYRETAHYGCVLEQDGSRVLVVGDCALCAEGLARLVEAAGPVDVALMPFPWLTLRRGREFVDRYIRPRWLVIDHLPFSRDDVYGYRQAAYRAATAVSGVNVCLLTEPFQQVTIW